MLVRCNTCKGAKKMMQIGCVEGDCPTCKASGYVEFDKALEQAQNRPLDDIVDDMSLEPKAKRKRRTKAEIEAANEAI